MASPKNPAPKSSKAAAAAAPEPEPEPEEKAGSAAPAATATTAQATAAVSSAVGVVRERLVAGEQLVLAAAGSIVLVYLLFEFLLDYNIFVGSFTVVIAVLTVLAIWVHRWGHYDFGNGYRIIVGALGISLALFAVTSLLGWARAGGGAGDFLRLIGLVIYWISGIVAGYGAWLVFRTRED
jgi:hypothetical protein